MENENKNKVELAKDLLKRISNLEKEEEIESLLKDNVIEFEVKGIKYRLHKPTVQEKIEVKNFRTKKYLELLKDDKFMFKQQLIDLYKQKGIDIYDLQKQQQELQNEIEKLMLKLAELGNLPNDDPNVVELRSKILSLKEEQTILFIQERDLLSHSIEDILLEQVHLYFTYILLEKLVNDQWVKAYNSFEEFCNSSDNEVIDKALYYVSLLITVTV
jgi:hypothetical protein